MLQTDTLALPGASESSRPKDYEDFLTVFAHEYFHAWLVKHLRPASFLPYKLERECHTHDLWVFEGFTTYYENVLPFRAGVLDEDKLLSLTSARFNRVREREGFHVESLSDASFNAWTHLYKQTPDSAYCQASYYGKGAVLAFMLDAALRKAGFSLDEVLKTWFHEALADPQARSLPDGGFFERIPVASIAERFKNSSRPRTAPFGRTNGAAPCPPSGCRRKRTRTRLRPECTSAFSLTGFASATPKVAVPPMRPVSSQAMKSLP